MNQHAMLVMLFMALLVYMNLSEVNSGQILIWPLSMMVYSSRIHIIAKMGEILNPGGGGALWYLGGCIRSLSK